MKNKIAPIISIWTDKVYYDNHLSTATRFKCGNVIEVLPVNRFHSSCIIDVLLRCSIEFFCVTLYFWTVKNNPVELAVI